MFFRDHLIVFESISLRHFKQILMASSLLRLLPNIDVFVLALPLITTVATMVGVLLTPCRSFFFRMVSQSPTGKSLRALLRFLYFALPILVGLCFKINSSASCSVSKYSW